MTQGLLPGPGPKNVMPDVDLLLRQNRSLKADVERLNLELHEEKEKTLVICSSQNKLKQILEPLHNGLLAIFGELQYSQSEGATNVSFTGEQGDPYWENWKQKLPGRPAEFIQAMLEHGEMTQPQLMIACKCGQKTVYSTIGILHKAQLIVKNGGRFSLKPHK